MYFSELAMKKVIEMTRGSDKTMNLLDIGCGDCKHSKHFCEAGIKVTGLDISECDFKHENFEFHQTFFDQYEKDRTEAYDFVWASHVLEHMLDPQQFLVDAKSFLKLGGLLCITVPPLKHQIVGGHVNLFNAGIILYRAVLAGFDCKYAMVHKYGYNISVFLQNHDNDLNTNDLNFDNGDIEKISKWLPKGYDYQGFNGDIKSLNWT